MLSEKLHHSSDNIPVLFQSFCEDEDIIKVYHYYSFGDQVFENSIHHGWKVAGLLVNLKNMTRGL